MWRMAGMLPVLTLVLAGCVSRQVYETDVNALKSQTEAYRAQATGLSLELRNIKAEKEKLDSQLKEIQASAGDSAQKLDALQKEYEAIQGSMAGQLRDVPGVVFDKSGAMQVTISFGRGGTETSAEATKTLKQIAAAIAKTTGLVFVDGHSDNVPVAAPETKKLYVDNLGLSLARAASVARVLEDGGVPSERLVVRGFGSTLPVESNDENEGRAKNRRVEIYYIPSPAPPVPEPVKLETPEPAKEPAEPAPATTEPAKAEPAAP